MKVKVIWVYVRTNVVLIFKFKEYFKSYSNLNSLQHDILGNLMLDLIIMIGICYAITVL